MTRTPARGARRAACSDQRHQHRRARCLSRWFPFLIGSVPLAVAMVGPFLRAERPTRLLPMGLSIVLSLAMPAIFLVGMYLPSFSIAGSISVPRGSDAQACDDVGIIPRRAANAATDGSLVKSLSRLFGLPPPLAPLVLPTFAAPALIRFLSAEGSPIVSG